MDKYGRDLDFDSMQGSTLAKSGSKRDSVSMDAKAVAVLSAAKMRCGGCGSKVDGHSSPLGVSLRSHSSVSVPLHCDMIAWDQMASKGSNGQQPIA